MKLLEKMVHLKLDSLRIEPNREWFKSGDNGKDIINAIEECKEFIDKIN